MKKPLIPGVLICLALLVNAGEAPGQPSLPPGVASLGSAGHMILAGVELALPMFIEAFDSRLARYLEAAGERRLTRLYTEKELRLVVIDKVQSQRPGAIQEPLVRIYPDGFHGSMRLSMGGVNAKIQGRIAFKPVNRRLHVSLSELFINGQVVPADLLKVMEHETNQMIDAQELLLDVSEFTTREGTVLISVEVR